ncbi:MAG TPA: hypothetical protein VFX98_15315 [Longimicrobiaceae bacterium]|nr:hypothetical protein [Longimicrobiaceae bacterium]
MISRVRPLLFLLAVIVGIKLTEQLYGYFAFGEERVLVRGLRGELVDAGAEITRTRTVLDSLRSLIKGIDKDLELDDVRLRRYERNLRAGHITLPDYEQARTVSARYNQRVERHNAWLHEYEAVLARNHRSVDRYNTLADSVRNLAARMGDPYYAVPTPVEAAVERGLLKLDTP